MNIVQTPSFERAVKKLHPNQKRDLDEAIKYLIKDPAVGELKKGDLSGVRVYKFRLDNQLTLLAYIVDFAIKGTLTLLAVGTHENFYRDLKR